MKKLKLLMAACALVSGSISVNAQTDVTASYIGDANRIIQGGGATCSDNHKLGNAAGSQGEGYFNTQHLGGWHNFVANTTNVTNGVESWTSGAGSEGWILGRVMILPQGKYTLKFTAMSTNQSGELGTNTVVKCGDEEKTFVGQGTYDEYSFDIDVTTANTPYEFGIYQKDGGTANWSVMGNISLTLNSTDVTPIANNSINAFTYSGNQTWHTNTWSTEGNSDGSKFITPFHELWVGSGNKLADATITGSYTPTESGVYKVSAWVRAMNEAGGAVSGVKIFVGDAEADACVGTSFRDGKARIGTFTAMADGVSGTPFQYGFKIENAEVNWLSFKNVTITYLGDLPQTEIDALMSQVPTGAMNATVKSTLEGYVSALESNKSVANYNALSLYLPTAQSSATVYTEISIAISNYAAKAAALDAAGQAAYDASAIQTKYDNGTYETLAEAEAELAAALMVAVKSQTTEGSDWTNVIINPSFESDFSNGWTNNGMDRQGNTSFGKTGSYYAEKWQPNGTFGLTQTIKEMPAGVYRLTARSKARGVTSAKIFAAGIDQAITIEDNENNYTVEFACDDNADVTIGFEGVGTGATNSWLCVDNFTLTLASAGLPEVTAVTGKMNAAIAEAQATAVEAYNASKTVANYNAASAAIAAAQSSVDAYTSANTALTKANEILNGTNLYTTEAYNTFKAIVDNAQTGYDNGTLTTEEANAINSTIFGTGWRSTAAIDDFLISAWDVNARDWSSYHVNTWSTIGDSGNPNFYNPCFEYWTGDASTLGDKVLTATLPDFVPGAEYKVTAIICLGVNTGVDASTAPTGVSLQLNNGDATACDTGSRVEKTRFYEGVFEANGMIGLDGKLNVKINVAGTNVSWMTFRNVKYEKTADAAAPTEAELTALDNAVNAVKNNVAGFEKDEYAPYNNIEAFAALAEAQAANRESKLSVTTATENLTGATWTINPEQMNAIYDGDFAIQEEHTTGPTALAGWNNPEGIRQLIKNTETFAGLNSASAKAAVFAWGNTTMTYGDTEGYNMPLEANTIYELSFKTCGWSDGDMGYVNVTVLNSDNEGMAQQTTATATKRIGEENPWDEFKIVFATGKAGNYRLGMWTSKHTTFTDLVLKKAASQVLEFADGAVPTYAPGTYPSVKVSRTLAADKWATAVYPFAVTIPAAASAYIKVATLDSYENGKLGFSTSGTLEANKPFMIRSSAAGNAALEQLGGLTMTNVAVAAATAIDATAGDASLKGVYATTEITNEATNYVLSNNTIYAVGAAGATINPYRAYIQLAQPAAEGARLTFVIDGEETTGIEGIAVQKLGEGSIYNLNGQRVAAQKKGLYIQNGKKVVVK